MTGTPFTAVIVDDEPLAIEGLKRQCLASGMVEVMGEATDGETGLGLIERLRPDAVFLDISMPGLSGLELAKAINASTHRPLVTFVTAHDDYGTEAFDLAVVDYVLKPIEPERMLRAIERMATTLLDREADTPVPTEFWVPFRGRIVKLAADQIIRIDAERDYVRLFSAENSYLVRVTLTDMMSRLDPKEFVRIHRFFGRSRRCLWRRRCSAEQPMRRMAIYAPGTTPSASSRDCADR